MSACHCGPAHSVVRSLQMHSRKMKHADADPVCSLRVLWLAVIKHVPVLAAPVPCVSCAARVTPILAAAAGLGLDGCCKCCYVAFEASGCEHEGLLQQGAPVLGQMRVNRVTKQLRTHAAQRSTAQQQ